MKKLLILFLLGGCGYAPMDNTKHCIITGVTIGEKGFCNYYGYGNGYLVGTWTSDFFKFRDTCGKYQIGDTIKFTR